MRDAKELEWIDGMEYLCSIPKGDGDIVDMVVKDGVLYVASANHLYKLQDERRFEKLYTKEKD